MVKLQIGAANISESMYASMPAEEQAEVNRGASFCCIGGGCCLCTGCLSWIPYFLCYHSRMVALTEKHNVPLMR